MAFRLEASESVGEGIKRIVREQLDKAIGEIDDEKLPRHEVVHQVRKRCKKIRAVLRLVRPTIGDRFRSENSFFRNTARELSGLRDAKVLLATCDRLIGAFADKNYQPRLISLRQKLAHHRRKMTRDLLHHGHLLERVRTRFSRSLHRIPGWKLESGGFDAIEGGLLRTYARGRKAMRRAYRHPGAGNFHDWRKRAKDHRYQIRLLQNLWAPLLQPLRSELEALSRLIGEDHDLAVFREMLIEASDKPGVECDLMPLLDRIDRRSAELRSKARPLGKRIFAEKPKRLGKRFHKYWDMAGFPG